MRLPISGEATGFLLARIWKFRGAILKFPDQEIADYLFWLHDADIDASGKCPDIHRSTLIRMEQRRRFTRSALKARTTMAPRRRAFGIWRAARIKAEARLKDLYAKRPQ